MLKKLIEGNELLNTVPACKTTGRGPIVKLQHNLILDDGNCFESPTLLMGNVGTGKTCLMKEIQEPIMEYSEERGDNVVIFCAKPDMLCYKREEDWVISINSKEPNSCWNIFEEMEGLRFKIGPKSFYQTNSEQAYTLYKVARNFAGLTGNELVYDLYTGTGTIANFVSRQAKKVIGIEYVPEAIEDAKVNSEINHITNTLFYAGDMKDILTQEFINEHGRPDVIITDPPRAGMPNDVINTILFAEPERIVYVSCNPATQARDLSLLDTKYKVVAVQPVDMFPHTHHVENVVLLERR